LVDGGIRGNYASIVIVESAAKIFLMGISPGPAIRNVGIFY
jgi:hypothetical protein